MILEHKDYQICEVSSEMTICLLCLNCHSYYQEVDNHDHACTYHPGTFGHSYADAWSGADAYTCCKGKEDSEGAKIDMYNNQVVNVKVTHHKKLKEIMFHQPFPPVS